MGLWSFLGLKQALFPDIAFPVVVVTAQTTQIDPLTNEQQVTNPLEHALANIKGVSQIHSLSYPEFVLIDMSFDVGTDLESRKSEVQTAIAGVALPPRTKTTVSPVDLNETYVVTYALTQTSRSMGDLAALANSRLAPRLSALPGVLKVQVVGGTAKGPDASVYRYDGRSAVAVAVVKQASANALDVAEACDDVVNSLRASLANVTIVQASSQATYIREATRATQEALGLAVLLAILVILPFLWDWRATAISALATPMALLGTSVVMRVFHFNLETITLLALALVVGVIVDDAIVMIENIFRHLEEGERPRQAAIMANREIGRTMVATTMTIVAVFLPIGLMSGTLGTFFKPFGITASAAVLFSLLAARTLTPTLAAMWFRPRTSKHDHDRVAEGPSDAIDRYPAYRRALRWALTHRAAVAALAIAAFLAGLALIPFIPKGFIPHLDRGEFHVTFATPLGTSLDDTVRTASVLEDAIHRDHDVSHTYTQIGGRAGQPTSQGLIDVQLKANRSLNTVQNEGVVRELLPQLDGVTASAGDVPFVGSDTTKPLDFALLSNDLPLLRTAGRNFEHYLQHQDGFIDVTASGLSDGTPFSAIEHVAGVRAVQITADLAPRLRLGDAADIVAAAARKELPRGVKLRFAGASADAVTTFRDFGLTLALSVVAIFAVLVFLFRSWVDPLVISVALPLSIAGALFALWLVRADFSLISLMGVIFLLGLVNKNAILLVDRIKRLRASGLGRDEAIFAAGGQRLRPILMTTAATILGMIPIAIGFGAGAELRSPMAVAIIGGLITSTLLSLIVVPVTYTLIDDFERTIARGKRHSERHTDVTAGWLG